MFDHHSVFSKHLGQYHPHRLRCWEVGGNTVAFLTILILKNSPTSNIHGISLAQVELERLGMIICISCGCRMTVDDGCMVDGYAS